MREIQSLEELKKIELDIMKSIHSGYSCAMKSHFRKTGNQMSGRRKSFCASLLA